MAPTRRRTKRGLLISKTGDMEGTSCRLPAGIKGVHAQLGWIVGQTHSYQTRLHRLFHGAADRAGKVGLRGALQRNLPSDDIFVGSIEFTLVDHVSTSDRAICPDNAREPFFELSHGKLL